MIYANSICTTPRIGINYDILNMAILMVARIIQYYHVLQ